MLIDIKKLKINLFATLGCMDTPNWMDHYDVGCKVYEEFFCENGALNPGLEFLASDDEGEYYNYPVDNCCVCGKSTGN